MTLVDLHHIAIKTGDLRETNSFYCDVLGMRMVERPQFSFRGSWLSFNNTMIHIMAGDVAVDDSGTVPKGTGAVDHIAISAPGFEAMRARLSERGVDWRQLSIPEPNIWQLFFRDPNGILLELNYFVPDEPSGSKGPDGTKVFKPGNLPVVGLPNISLANIADTSHGKK